MATIKVLLDLRRAKSDGSFNIIFRITNLKKVYTINSGISLQKYFWNEKKMEVEKSHPNSKLLNIKLSKNYFKIEQAVLSLDDEFSIEKIKAMLHYKNKLILRKKRLLSLPMQTHLNSIQICTFEKQKCNIL